MVSVTPSLFLSFSFSLSLSYARTHARTHMSVSSGDKDQRERTRTMNAFKDSRINLLCATDVAARGLDVKDITHVINFDFPLTKGAGGIEDYVHRIGRTGRAGAKGKALTFFTRKDAQNAHKLVQLLVKAKQKVPEELEQMARSMPKGRKPKWGRGGGRGGRGRGGGGRRGGRGGGGRGGRRGGFRR